MRCQEPQVQRGLQGISAKSCPCLPVFLQFSFLFSLGWRDLPALCLLEQRDGITFVQKVCSQTCFLTGSAIFLLPFPSFSKCCPARGSVCWDSDWQQEGEPWPHLPSSGQAKALIQPSSAKCPGLGAAKGKRLQPRRPGWGLLVLPVGWGMPRTLLIPRDLLWVQAVRAGGPWWLQSLSPQRQREPRPEWPLAPCPEFGVSLGACGGCWNCLSGCVLSSGCRGLSGLGGSSLQPPARKTWDNLAGTEPAIPWGIPAGTASQCLLEPGYSPPELPL
ncbi:uncharacterized protein LOC127465186 [Manacus candei]|uniref:uncharacterized protein LOC127465186 n=1 Tax=Manacus candei TaxID=415023 RepID=UPI0022275532|nr:uncharacterized protein LOC127465186 [Manacus candei]